MMPRRSTCHYLQQHLPCRSPRLAAIDSASSTSYRPAESLPACLAALSLGNICCLSYCSGGPTITDASNDHPIYIHLENAP